MLTIPDKVGGGSDKEDIADTGVLSHDPTSESLVRVCLLS